MLKTVLKGISTLVLLAGLLACDTPDTTTGSQERAAGSDQLLKPGAWRVVVDMQGVKMPFQMEVMPAVNGGDPRVYFINGEERVEAQSVDEQDGMVEVRMDSFNTGLTGRIDGDTWTGTLYKVKRDVTEQLPFVATHGQHYRFFQMLQKPEIDVSGRWEVTFTEPDGETYPAVGIFKQDGANVTGTFLTTTSDYRFLAGSVRGSKLFLSAYDGYHIFHFEAELTDDGRLVGDFRSGASWQESWAAERNPQAELPDVDKLTYLKEGYESFDFTFPNLEGEQVSLSDPRFQDKVVIVQIAGSWCPNCADETRFLAPWYKQNKDRGVEVVALMFEHFDEFEKAAEQVKVWRQQWGVTYPTLIAGTSEKTTASGALPELNAVLAYPTTIFIGKDGKVQRIHNGFSGPATGERHEQEIASFNATVDALLNESADTE